MYVTYDDTPCFALGYVKDGERISPDSFITLVITAPGAIKTEYNELTVKKGDKLFVPYGCGEILSEGAEAIVCYPPKI